MKEKKYDSTELQDVNLKEQCWAPRTWKGGIGCSYSTPHLMSRALGHGDGNSDCERSSDVGKCCRGTQNCLLHTYTHRQSCLVENMPPIHKKIEYHTELISHVVRYLSSSFFTKYFQLSLCIHFYRKNISSVITQVNWKVRSILQKLKLLLLSITANIY